MSPIDGIGVLWTTHLIDEIALTDSVVVLHQGKVLEKGIATDILARTGAARTCARLRQNHRRRHQPGSCAVTSLATTQPRRAAASRLRNI